MLLKESCVETLIFIIRCVREPSPKVKAMRDISHVVMKCVVGVVINFLWLLRVVPDLSLKMDRHERTFFMQLLINI